MLLRGSQALQKPLGGVLTYGRVVGFFMRIYTGNLYNIFYSPLRKTDICRGGGDTALLTLLYAMRSIMRSLDCIASKILQRMYSINRKLLMGETGRFYVVGGGDYFPNNW